VRDYLRLTLGGLPHEVFLAMWLDAQNRLITTEELFRGTLTQTSVYPREVVKRALAHNAAAVILAHNHPSGVAEPSAADVSLTRVLKEALNLVDVRLLDHFIVAGTEQPLSLAERGRV
jgi:DNA repair protein RadC